MFFGHLIEGLFSFPLRYLCSIGYHAIVLSLRWISTTHIRPAISSRPTHGIRITDRDPPGRVKRPVPQDIIPMLRIQSVAVQSLRLQFLAVLVTARQDSVMG